jgi:TrwC relaxase
LLATATWVCRSGSPARLSRWVNAAAKIVDGDVSPFRLEVAKRVAAMNVGAGLPAGAPVPAADRARVRTEVARQFFLIEHGREPVDARELAGQIAKDSRPRTQTVAGYDLTFSPVKSVSVLWAVADPTVAAVIERAHQAAVHKGVHAAGAVRPTRATSDGAWGVWHIECCDPRGGTSSARWRRGDRGGIGRGSRADG